MALPITRIGRPQPDDRTPYDHFVAFRLSVRRGVDGALPKTRDLLGHLLQHDGAHPVVTLTVGHDDDCSSEVFASDGRLVPVFADPEVRATWRSGRLPIQSRKVLVALAKVFPVLNEHTMALVVMREPGRGGRSLGIGFALDAEDFGAVLWDLEGYAEEHTESFLVRRYGGQEARESATIRRQYRMMQFEADLPMPQTRKEAAVAALEYALRRSVTEWLPDDFVQHLPADLREVVEANFDLLWDTQRDEPRSIDDLPDEDAKHLCLTRYLGAYQ